MTESRELAAHDGGQSREVAAPRATSINAQQRLDMMREAMLNPAVDPDKARSMLQLMRELENDERQAEFNRDKGRAIRAMPAIFKRGENTHTGTRYAKFEDMHRAIMPVLAQHFLTLDFRIGYEGNWITVQPILRHDNGFIEEGGVMKGPADEGKGRSNIQAIGSASSYLKRYSMRAMLNLIEDGEDDDGMGVARPDFQLNDRQQGLLVDAQQAADRGEYADWYGRQNRKDKAILINSGTHARLGGGTALPGPATIDQRQPDPEPARDDPPAQEQRQQPSGHDTTTPEGWTAQYEDDCAAAVDLEGLQRIQTKATKGIARLKEADAKLHQRAIDAGSKAHQRLTANAGGGLFGDDE